MNKETPAKRILIVSDSSDELHAVRNLLSSDLGGYWSADSDAEGLALFSEKQPAVLILAFMEIGKAERFYLTLYRQCTQIQDIPHQTVVLCKNTEAEQAFSLCLNGSVDDYVVNRPLYDPYRLRLSVRQALDRRVDRQTSSRLTKQLSGVGKDLQQVDEYVGKSLAQGERRQQEALAAYQEYRDRVTNQLSVLESQLFDSMLSGIPAQERKALAQQLDLLRKKATEPDARRMQGRLQESSAWLDQFTKNYNERVQPLREVPYPPPQPEVMVVEDDPIYRDMLQIMLDSSGFRVIAAENGEDALNELRRRRPDLILLDYQMPGMDGILTLQRIKADPDLRAVPVIMLTAVSERVVVQKCIQIGALDFIVKPSDRGTIVNKIAQRLPVELRRNLPTRPDIS